MLRIRTLAMVGVFALDGGHRRVGTGRRRTDREPRHAHAGPTAGRGVPRERPRLTLCHTVFLEEFANEPAFDLRAAPSTRPCTIPARGSAGTAMGSS